MLSTIIMGKKRQRGGGDGLNSAVIFSSIVTIVLSILAAVFGTYGNTVAVQILSAIMFFSILIFAFSFPYDTQPALVEGRENVRPDYIKVMIILLWLGLSFVCGLLAFQYNNYTVFLPISFSFISFSTLLQTAQAYSEKKDIEEASSDKPNRFIMGVIGLMVCASIITMIFTLVAQTYVETKGTSQQQ